MIHLAQKRIPRFATTIRDFIRFVNGEYPGLPHIKVYIHGHRELFDSSWPGVKLYGYCATSPKTTRSTIRVAVGGLDKYMAMIIIAHEICHAIDHYRKVRMREDAANHFGVVNVLNYIAEEQKNKCARRN